MAQETTSNDASNSSLSKTESVNQSDQDLARAAAVDAAADLAEGASVLAIGSGRAAFALTRKVAERYGRLGVITASKLTAEVATEVGLDVLSINDLDRVDVSFDGADEIDPNLGLIKGAGAALLREKLVFALADRVVIIAEDHKLVDRLGSSRELPIEIVPFAWSHTLDRLMRVAGDAVLWTNEDGSPFVTDNGNHLAEVPIPSNVDLNDFANELKATLGVIEHGLFLTEANEALIGSSDGSVKHLTRN